MKFRLRVALVGLVVVYSLVVGSSHLSAASFLFGSDAGGANDVIFNQPGRSTATLVDDGVTATFASGPVGGLLNDHDGQGLGIDTSQLADVSDGGSIGDTTKMNIIDGTNAVSGQGESISFSFDQAGVLQVLMFDGMKDETLEYFSLALPNRNTLTIFDSQAEFRLGLQGFTLADLSVANPVQAQTEDDDLTDIGYAFQAGEVFVLTYGEGDYAEVPGYRTNPAFPPQVANTAGNGARFQGVIVDLVPEPSSCLLACWSLSASLLLRRRS